MKNYGIKLTLPEGDPMRNAHLLGDEWESYHWYETQQERDRALSELSGKHLYSRSGDVPSLVVEKVER